MKVISPAVEVIADDDLNIYQKIEKCGRICYKSETNITNDSAIKFTQNMIAHQHTAMLEHSHIYLKFSKDIAIFIEKYLIIHCTKNPINDIVPYLNITHIDNTVYMSGSIRTFINMFNSYFTGSYANCGLDAIYVELNSKYPEIFKNKNTVIPSILEKNTENEAIYIFDNANEFINYINKLNLCNANDIIAKHVVHSLVFTCDRGISHELVRHRPCSFAQESTRYCNYTKDKFNNEITVIKPFFFDDEIKYNLWYDSCKNSENAYFTLINSGTTPQEARSVLPNSLKTEIIVTATEVEWQHILNLRYHGITGKPHPQMYEIMNIAKDLLFIVSNNRLH